MTVKHTVALKQNHEFRRLYSKGRSAVSPYFVLYCRPNRRSYSRLGITTGVKLGNAVKRNRARRLCWESFRLLKDRLEVCHLLLIPRRRMEEAKRPEVTRELAGLLAKAGLLPAVVADSPPEC